MERPDPSLPARKAPTLYDVAAHAGVSHQTVSRLVRGQTNIRPDIRERIEAAISDLNYRPNRAARALATSKAHRLGALFYERFDEVGPARILQGASDAAREAGYTLDIVTVDSRDDEAIRTATSAIDQTDVAGIMIFAPVQRIIDVVNTLHFTVPIYIESDVNEANKQAGPTGNVIGERLLADHLLELGHRRFFEIAGPLDWIASQMRSDSFREWVVARGGEVVGIAEGDWSAGSGYRAAAVMPLDAGVTALVVGNDQMALGALKALEERGVRVPQDMSVVGFDDIPEASFYKPSLTTVRLDFDHQGRVVIDRLLQLVDPSIPRFAVADTPPEMFLRGSTGPAPTR